MDDWNRLGLCSGPLRFISIGKNHSSFDRFNHRSANHDEDSHFLEKKMTLERKIDGIPVRKVYVSNVAKETKNSDLLHLFKQFGEIVHVFISRKYDHDEQRRTTFAFVTFKNTESAACAIDHKKLLLGAKRLFVKAADSWHQPIVNPDGSVQYYASLCFNKNTVNTKKETEGESDGDEDVEDDFVGAVGGIAISCVSPQEIESCPVSKLNDDCLEHVFSRLPLECQIEASKVCKRWQAVISNMCRKIECLNFKDHFSSKIVNMDKVHTILEKVGPNLKQLICSLNDEILVINKSFISVVARYCTKLEVLEVSNVEIAKRSLMFLSKRCPNLRKVTFASCHRLTDHELAFLLSKENGKLEEINLIEITGICGKCFTNLQPPLKQITIDNCAYVKPELLVLGMTRIKDTLKSLTLKNCMSTHCYNINDIANIVPKLKNLNLSDIYPYPFSPSFSLEPLGKFTELESLDLSNNYFITDGIMSIIVNGCKLLKSLNLSGKTKGTLLTQNGIAELCNIKTLEELNVSRLEQVNDESMRHFSLVTPPPRIKRLVCFNCQNLSDKGAISILSSCKELEYFDLRNCLSITNETIKKAVSIVRKRTNSLPLKIMVYSTNISILDESSYSHPLLKLDFTDDSIMNHLLDDIFVCGNGNAFCGGMDCQCCIGFDDDDDDFMSDSDEDVDDFLIDIDDFDLVDSDLGSDDCPLFFNII